jgi:AraC-like DNA-binding protein
VTTIFDATDALTRPAAIGVALFLAIVLLRSARAKLHARLAALSSAGTASYLMCSASPGVGLTTLPIVPLCIGNSVFFWWFIRSLFEDDFRLNRWAVAPLILALVVGLGRITTGGGAAPAINHTLVIVHGVFVASLVGHLFHSAWSGFADDMLDARRRFRVLFLIAGGLVAIGIAAAEVALMGAIAPSWTLALQSTVILAVLGWAGSSILILDPFALTFSAPKTTNSAPHGPDQPDRAWRDQSLEIALLRLMNEEQLFRRHNLTIADLAERLQVPEHNLRKLINVRLGHRNFNAFVNGYRIAWTKAVLADPAKARLPILTIALDAGFASLAPFNRAFRAELGLSPSDYRAQSPAGKKPIDSSKD